MIVGFSFFGANLKINDFCLLQVDENSILLSEIFKREKKNEERNSQEEYRNGGK